MEDIEEGANEEEELSEKVLSLDSMSGSLMTDIGIIIPPFTKTDDKRICIYWNSSPNFALKFRILLY